MHQLPWRMFALPEFSCLFLFIETNYCLMRDLFSDGNTVWPTHLA